MYGIQSKILKAKGKKHNRSTIIALLMIQLSHQYQHSRLLCLKGNSEYVSKDGKKSKWRQKVTAHIYLYQCNYEL